MGTPQNKELLGALTAESYLVKEKEKLGVGEDRNYRWRERERSNTMMSCR